MIRKKHKKKVEHLVKKYGRRSRSGWEDMFREVKDFKGNPRIFGDKEEAKDPVVVEGKDCKISITKEESSFVKLGPKFCVLRNLNEEEFEADLEECIVKIKWDMIGGRRG